MKPEDREEFLRQLHAPLPGREPAPEQSDRARESELSMFGRFRAET